MLAEVRKVLSGLPSTLGLPSRPPAGFPRARPAGGVGTPPALVLVLLAAARAGSVHAGFFASERTPFTRMPAVNTSSAAGALPLRGEPGAAKGVQALEQGGDTTSALVRSAAFRVGIPDTWKGLPQTCGLDHGVSGS